MDFTKGLRQNSKSNRQLTEEAEQKRIKESATLMASRIMTSIRYLAEHGKFTELPSGARRIHCNFGYTPPMSYSLVSTGGLFHGKNDRKYKITIDISNYKYKIVTDLIKSELGKSGITINGPYIGANWTYHTYHDWQKETVTTTLSSVNKLNKSRVSCTKWNPPVISKEDLSLNPFSYLEGIGYDNCPNYIAYLEVEVIF